MALRAAAVLALKAACRDDPAALTWLQAATQHAEVAAPREALQQKEFWRVPSSLLRVTPHHVPGRVVALTVRRLRPPSKKFPLPPHPAQLGCVSCMHVRHKAAVCGDS